MREKYCWLVGAGWLVLILCEREILLAGCSEDEANRVLVKTKIGRQTDSLNAYPQYPQVNKICIRTFFKGNMH